jgi:hypothetical protein
MAVPEAAVHEDDLVEAWEREVGTTGEIVTMLSIPKSETVD